MIVATPDVLAGLSKDELWEAALDKQNTPDIQDIALRNWMALDEHDHLERMGRLRSLLRQSWELVRTAGIEGRAS